MLIFTYYEERVHARLKKIWRYILITAIFMQGRVLCAKEKHHFDVSSSTLEALSRAKKLEDLNSCGAAFAVYKGLIDKDDKVDSKKTAYLWYRLAFAQSRCGYMIEATSSMKSAVALNPRNSGYHSFLAKLQRPRPKPKDKPAGHQLSNRYAAYRDMGTARRLRNETGVLHIFVNDRNSENWTPTEILRTKVEIERASQWLGEEAVHRQINPKPTFTHQYLAMKNDLLDAKVDIPTYSGLPTLREAWLRSVPPRLGAVDFDSLYKQAFEGVIFPNRAIVFHINRTSRSFAVFRCGSSSDGGWETAFVNFPARKIDNPRHAVTYTHELLHLYGADDLYNKAADPSVLVQEVMNHGGESLEKSVLCPLTTFAIGWTDQVPKTTVLKVDIFPVP